MQWSELFPKGREPSHNQIREFVDTRLWDRLTHDLEQTYGVQPKLFYSNCSMQNGMWAGWNVKYMKSGKALCTLYPKQGYFLSLVPIGLREMNEAELLMSSCTDYTRNLFGQTVAGHQGKSMAFEVKDDEILQDVIKLIALRKKPNAAC